MYISLKTLSNFSRKRSEVRSEYNDVRFFVANEEYQLDALLFIFRNITFMHNAHVQHYHTP